MDMKIICCFFLLVCSLAQPWHVTLSINNQTNAVEKMNVDISNVECKYEKAKYHHTLSTITLCMTADIEQIRNKNAYQPLDDEYSRCYRYSQTLSTQFKDIRENVISLFQMKFKQYQIQINDLHYTDFVFEACLENPQQIISFQVIKPFLSLDQLRTQLAHHDVKPEEQTVNERNGIIMRKISGRGFHQQLNYTVIPPPGLDINAEQCKIVVEDVLPETTYVDSDQLNAYGKVTRRETINIEKPQYLAKQYMYRIEIGFGQLQELDPTSYYFSYPIHFRYPTPRSKAEYVEVDIHPLEKAFIECESVHRFPLKEDTDIDRGVAKIPVGDSSQLSLVSMLTFVVEMITALLLVKQIKG